MVRTPCFDKNGMKKGAWSEEEDNKLRAYIQRYGHWNWRELPKYAGLARCGKSCRLRWLNYLRPNVKRGDYTKEEEELIMKLHDEIGNKWSVIATKLPGRTDNEIKNHWHTTLNKRAKPNPISFKRKRISTETSQSEPNRKDQSSGNSQFKANQERELAPDAPAQQIQESCPQCLDQSPNEFPSLSSEYAFLSDINWVAEDGISSSESFAEPVGNFWSEPFLADNDTITNDFLAPLFDPGFLSPPSPIIGEEFLWSYGLCDELNNTSHL